ncbi:LuxR family transcriptional regulator [Nostoc linckia z18]|jgi:DNA-binding CsgD family transcriptional regulator|uniref:LuxR family transcriptional regulator n=3 Tax=Nostoc linckia TaxID=92942 RepID=A0A9Q6ENG5_NOSLI|nr:helix-turn-helix transcriptional regulator [Nostoc linckia]PHK23697.1 LuxR family transcriptional regulator [Nostoc linckia z14]PHK39185.1 LuxR family transcriptional regulator [Nostoc linckia z15]PHK46759.1 LuxR family transcriptional regulator [Nostoc linckia z16]PHJ69088.1 LuxR family transcriptional regulator [Nostoc linckia z1]PHJ73239.1 LuxR family transcriptional regulator [Nostoc linckia z3]
MMTLTKTLIETQLRENINRDSQRADFLEEVIESLEDGILILNKAGKVLHANASAHRIFSQFHQENCTENFLPPAIWNLCESLLKNQSLLPDTMVTFSHEIVLDKSNIFRIRVRLLNMDGFDIPCLLVTIQNKYESLKDVALSEVKKFDLTHREAEIWFLYRNNHSYKEIANQLFITINTVKKHMKNIHAKRQAALLLEEQYQTEN